MPGLLCTEPPRHRWQEDTTLLKLTMTLVALLGTNPAWNCADPKRLLADVTGVAELLEEKKRHPGSLHFFGSVILIT